MTDVTGMNSSSFSMYAPMLTGILTDRVWNTLSDLNTLYMNFTSSNTVSQWFYTKDMILFFFLFFWTGSDLVTPSD